MKNLIIPPNIKKFKLEPSWRSSHKRVKKKKKRKQQNRHEEKRRKKKRKKKHILWYKRDLFHGLPSSVRRYKTAILLSLSIDWTGAHLYPLRLRTDLLLFIPSLAKFFNFLRLHSTPRLYVFNVRVTIRNVLLAPLSPPSLLVVSLLCSRNSWVFGVPMVSGFNAHPERPKAIPISVKEARRSALCCNTRSICLHPVSRGWSRAIRFFASSSDRNTEPVIHPHHRFFSFISGLFFSSFFFSLFFFLFLSKRLLPTEILRAQVSLALDISFGFASRCDWSQRGKRKRRDCAVWETSKMAR